LSGKVKIFLLTLTIGMSMELASAQSCPLRLDGVEAAKLSSEGWLFGKSPTEISNLQGLAINEGPLNDAEKIGDGYLLKPQFVNGVNIWLFPKKVGGNEVWMRCVYCDGVVANRRLSATVSKCVERLAGRDAKGNQLLASAGCFEK